MAREHTVEVKIGPGRWHMAKTGGRRETYEAAKDLAELSKHVRRDGKPVKSTVRRSELDRRRHH